MSQILSALDLLIWLVGMVCQSIQTSIPRIHLKSFQSFKNPRVSQEMTTTVYSGGTFCNKWSTSSTRLCLFSRFSPVFTRGKFCRRCTWRFSCFSQYLSSRDKPSILLKGVFEDRKCFEINNFFAGVDPDRPRSALLVFNYFSHSFQYGVSSLTQHGK